MYFLEVHTWIMVGESITVSGALLGALFSAWIFPSCPCFPSFPYYKIEYTSLPLLTNEIALNKMSVLVFDEVSMQVSDIYWDSSAVKRCRKCYFSDLVMCAVYHSLPYEQKCEKQCDNKPLPARASSGIEMHIENIAPSELIHLKVFFN